MHAHDELLGEHIAKLDVAKIDRWALDFSENQVAILDEILPHEFQKSLIEEARFLLENEAERRELIVKESGGTPRSYKSVGRDSIAEHGSYIPAVFYSNKFRAFLSKIAGQEVHPVPYDPEAFVINSLSTPRDTHGWHWDDYAFALIWCVDEPDPLSGGRVEYIPHSIWEKNDPEAGLRETLRENPVTSLHLKEGDCYFMKSNTCLHRVTPILEETKRTAVIYAFASTEDLSDTSITHTSMEEIYPKESASTSERV